jgi:hypothetical protein
MLLDLDLSAAFDTVDLQSRLTVFSLKGWVSVSTSRSRDLPKSRLGLVSNNLANVSVSVSYWFVFDAFAAGIVFICYALLMYSFPEILTCRFASGY